MDNENIDDLLKSISAGSFSQWLADNVDHNVKTIDGKGSLRGMGMIVSTTGGNIGQMNVALPQIPRQIRMLAREVVKNKGIPLLEYYPSAEASGLSKLQRTKLLELKETAE